MEAAAEEQEEGTPQPPVPIDICMKPDTRCVIITGPNTGGKTATLKVGPYSLLEVTSLIPGCQGCTLFALVLLPPCRTKLALQNLLLDVF